MHLFEVYPLQDLVLERAQGSFIWDALGNKYLDMYGGHAVISIGHTHPHYVRRIGEQLDKIGFYSNSVRLPLQERLAEKLVGISGKGGYKLFLCNSGAEANENALKLASFYNNRKRVVAFTNAFHGRTSLAVAATDSPALLAPVNRTDAVTFLPFNDEEALVRHFEKHGDEISSVIVEGIQGVGGIRAASDDFLCTIRRLCDKHGGLMIADSVQCGYGRSGKFFSHDHSGIRADIYSMAKGMGNGFPIGGILVAPHIKPRLGMLGTTFGGNPLACAAALAVLEVMEQESLMSNAVEIGNYIMGELSRLPIIKNIRGKGLMIGFDVPDTCSDIRNRLLSEHHILTGEAKPHVVRLLPSLSIKKEEADLFIRAMEEVLR